MNIKLYTLRYNCIYKERNCAKHMGYYGCVDRLYNSSMKIYTKEISTPNERHSLPSTHLYLIVHYNPLTYLHLHIYIHTVDYHRKSQS